ncbi:hypothetical protein R1sor_014627 [Riccia sorocarpa]|uniref:Uncharacterized protein n=1 Tax=Riccia sorocarpa TaxID=122646 RepID=A0ABD3HA63_9MARC
MQSAMENTVLLKCAYTGECEYLETSTESHSVEVQDSYLAVRFRLKSDTIFVSQEIVSESGDVATRSVRFIDDCKSRSWRLEEGTTNIVFGLSHAPSTSQKCERIVDEDNQQTDSSQRFPEEPVLLNSSTPNVSRLESDPYPGWPGFRRDPHLLSAFDASMMVSAACELGKIDLKTFSYQRVLELPNSYDGNIIFELPPVGAHDAMRRNGFRVGMDRRNDCFLWTRLITTDACHGQRKMFEISHVSCVGFLKCSNHMCPYMGTNGVPNVSDWPTGIFREHKYTEGQFVPGDGHKCPHCNSPAMCTKSCSAKMFFLLPSKGKKTSPSPEQASHISRCAIHVGSHCHPARFTALRHLVQLVVGTVKEEFERNPRVSPSIVRRRATASVVDKLKSSGLTVDMTEEEKKELFLGISAVAHPDKILNMIKSIRRSSAPMGELSAIASMQKNTMLRTVQRSLFPGQAEKDSNCFVFKMPDLGSGSGVDLPVSQPDSCQAFEEHVVIVSDSDVELPASEAHRDLPTQQRSPRHVEVPYAPMDPLLVSQLGVEVRKVPVRVHRFLTHLWTRTMR